MDIQALHRQLVDLVREKEAHVPLHDAFEGPDPSLRGVNPACLIQYGSL